MSMISNKRPLNINERKRDEPYRRLRRFFFQCKRNRKRECAKDSVAPCVVKGIGKERKALLLHD